MPRWYIHMETATSSKRRRRRHTLSVTVATDTPANVEGLPCGTWHSAVAVSRQVANSVLRGPPQLEHGLAVSEADVLVERIVDLQSEVVKHTDGRTVLPDYGSDQP